MYTLGVTDKQKENMFSIGCSLGYLLSVGGSRVGNPHFFTKSRESSTLNPSWAIDRYIRPCCLTCGQNNGYIYYGF